MKIVQSFLILRLFVAITLLTPVACGALERSAPQRSFTPEDLLIDRTVIPYPWEAFEPIPPIGHDLYTEESTTKSFGVTNTDGTRSVMASHRIFRHLTIGNARRRFEVIYLPRTKHMTLATPWRYQSSLAEQSHFGCSNLAGNVGVICKWGAQYEEYIISFQAKMPPEGMTLAEMEQVVKAIDEKMAQYLHQD